MTPPEDHLKAAKADYLNDSYPGDLADVLNSESRVHTAGEPVVESSKPGRRVSAGWISAALAMAGLIVISLINWSLDRQLEQQLVEDDSSNTEVLIKNTVPVIVRRRTRAKLFTPIRSSSTRTAATRQKRMRLFTALSTAEKPKTPASSKRKPVTLALTSAGHKGMTRTSWWKSGSITLVSRSTRVRQSGGTGRRTGKSGRSRKRSPLSDRFHFDPLHNFRST